MANTWKSLILRGGEKLTCLRIQGSIVEIVDDVDDALYCAVPNKYIGS